MKFLVDNQLPRRLAQYLHERGFDAQHVLDVGLASASDAEICEYAETQQRIIVSKDEDFFYRTSIPTRKSGSSGCAWATVELDSCWRPSTGSGQPSKFA